MASANLFGHRVFGIGGAAPFGGFGECALGRFGNPGGYDGLRRFAHGGCIT